ncbi:MAG: protein-L-isoaspartate O-methyltransferase [Rhodothalassiaceae bacterium]
MSQSHSACLAMIAGQLRPNRISDERLLKAFEAVPRERFVPATLRGVAYVDEDLPVASGRYLMEPMVLARLIMDANLEPHDSVLDIGCATGYSTALLAQLAESVVALEQDGELAATAQRKVADLGLTNVAVLEGKLAMGAPDQAPFDVILLNGCVERLPKDLLAQLSDGGRLVCVFLEHGVGRGRMVYRLGDIFSTRDLFDANVPPLPGFQKAPTFQF